jgi:hypothetical protein
MVLTDACELLKRSAKNATEEATQLSACINCLSRSLCDFLRGFRGLFDFGYRLSSKP